MSGLLSDNKWYILNYVLELDRRLEKLNEKLNEAPKGTLVHRTLKSGTVGYRHIVRENGKQTEKSLSQSEADSLQHLLNEKHTLKKELVMLKKSIMSNLSLTEKILNDAEMLLKKYYSVSNAVITENTYRQDELTHKSAVGIKVRSKSELLLLNLFESKHLKYEYEREIYLNGYSKPFHPDFVIYEPLSGKTYIWEHSGVYSKKYELYFENKMLAYKQNNIIEGKNLILTRDEKNGSIDMNKVEQIINRIFFLNEYKTIINKYK